MKILVTVKPGKENVTGRDLLDALFPFDFKVSFRKTGYDGVLLLETSLPFHRVAGILAWRRVRHLQRLAPLTVFKKIHEYTEEDLGLVLSGLKEGEKLAVMAKKRGISKEEVDRFLRLLYKALKKRGIVLASRKKASKILFVEFIGESVGLGLVSSKFYDFIRQRVASPF